MDNGCFRDFRRWPAGILSGLAFQRLFIKVNTKVDVLVFGEWDQQVGSASGISKWDQQVGSAKREVVAFKW